MSDDQGNYLFDIANEPTYFLIPIGDEPAADDSDLWGDLDSLLKPSITNANGNWNEFWWNDIFEDSETANFLSSLGLDFSHSGDSSLLSSDNQTEADSVDKREDHQDDPVGPSTSTDTQGRAEQPRKSRRPRRKCTPRIIPTGPGPYECNTCRKKYFWKSNLIKHYYRAQTYDDSGKKELAQIRDAAKKNEPTAPCAPAKEELSGTQMLEVVMSQRRNKRRQELRCDKCDRVYFHRTHFNYHYRVHTGEKPHACKVCDMKFARSDCLKNHERIHTGEKPYCCDVCGTRFSRSGYLRKHTRKLHPN